MPVVPYRNPLSYPAGCAPGFDPSHFATGTRTRVSAIASGSGYINLLSGAPATITSAFTPGVSSNLGPNNYGKNTDSASFSGLDTGTYPLQTLAAIVQHDGAAESNARVAVGGNVTFYIWGTNLRTWEATAATNINSLLTLAANIPWFIGVSRKSGSFARFWALNMNTNVLLYDERSSTVVIGAENGTLTVNDGVGTTKGLYQACGMHSNALLDLGMIRAWCSNPWSFWYPPRQYNVVAPSATATFQVAWARNANSITGKGAAL